MQTCSALALLLLAASTLPARGSPPEPSCLHFSELLPAKLKELRMKFEEIKDYFQSKDDELSIQLLNSELLDEFKGNFGCQSVSEMMRFYMEEVLPSAMRTSTHHQQSMGDLGNLLLSLGAGAACLYTDASQNRAWCSRDPITSHRLSQMGPALPLAESTAGLPSPSPMPLATGRGAGKESESMLGSHHTRFTGTRCKAAAVAAPERPMASRGEGEGGDRRGGSDEGRAAAARPGKETRVVEAVVLIPLQHRFFTCEKRSKTIKHIKETFDKMNENGIYKAMGEFDIFINYIEEYLLMKRKK